MGKFYDVWCCEVIGIVIAFSVLRYVQRFLFSFPRSTNEDCNGASVGTLFSRHGSRTLRVGPVGS